MGTRSLGRASSCLSTRRQGEAGHGYGSVAEASVVMRYSRHLEVDDSDGMWAPCASEW